MARANERGGEEKKIKKENEESRDRARHEERVTEGERQGRGRRERDLAATPSDERKMWPPREPRLIGPSMIALPKRQLAFTRSEPANHDAR